MVFHVGSYYTACIFETITVWLHIPDRPRLLIPTFMYNMVAYLLKFKWGASCRQALHGLCLAYSKLLIWMQYERALWRLFHFCGSGHVTLKHVQVVHHMYIVVVAWYISPYKGLVKCGWWWQSLIDESHHGSGRQKPAWYPSDILNGLDK